MAETIRQLLARSNALDKQITLDVESILWEREPSANPLLSISSKLAKGKKALNTKVEWLSKNPLPVEVVYTGADETTAATTGIVIANWSYLREGMQLFNSRTGETLRVTTTPATATPTVSATRDWGSSTAGAGLLKTGDILKIKGMSGNETDDLSDHPMAILPTEDYNYTEFSEHYCQTSKIAEAVQTITGEDLREQSVHDMENYHKKIWELALWFGERAQTLVGATYYCRTMRGIYNAISTNVWLLNDISDFVSLEFDGFLQQINRYSPDRKDKIAFLSPALHGRVSNWGMNKLVLNNQASKEFGMEITTYRGLTGGKIDFVEVPFFDDEFLSHLGFVLEWDKLQFRPLMPTKLELNVGEKYKNTWLDKISTCATMRLADECRMGMIKKKA